MKLEISSSLLKSSFVYTAINFVNKVFPFLLLPLFTRELSLSDFGIYNLVKASVGILIPCVGFNVSEAIVRNYFGFDKKKFPSYISSGLAIMLILCSFIILLTFIIPDELFRSMFEIKTNYIFIAILISYFTAINNIERGLLRCEGNNKLFAFLVLSQSILYFIIIISLYYCKLLSLSNLLYTEVGTFILFGIVSLILLRIKYKINFSFDFTYLKDIFKYSSPLVINSLLAYLFALSDRFLISNKLDNSAVALYSASFQVVSVLQILAVSFNAAWVPYIYKSLNTNEFNSFKKHSYFMMLFFLIAAVAYYFILNAVILNILGVKYVGSEKLIGWMILSNLLQSFYWIVSPVVQFYKRNWLLILASFPAFIFSISMNYIFLESEGIIFAAQINAMSWTIIFIITYFNSNKLLKNNVKKDISEVYKN